MPADLWKVVAQRISGNCIGSVAFMIFCSAGGSVTAEEKKPQMPIRVLEATYGANCTGVAKGNVTKFIASANRAGRRRAGRPGAFF